MQVHAVQVGRTHAHVHTLTHTLQHLLQLCDAEGGSDSVYLVKSTEISSNIDTCLLLLEDNGKMPWKWSVIVH